jgi:hypothetical protein
MYLLYVFLLGRGCANLLFGHLSFLQNEILPTTFSVVSNHKINLEMVLEIKHVDLLADTASTL